MPVSFTGRADVPFNWRQAGAAMAGSQQQACCVNLCTLLGRASVIAAVDQADIVVNVTIIIIIIIIIIIKNECHSNIIVDRLQGCRHSKKLRESESESRSSKVVWQARTLEQLSFLRH